MPCPGQARHDRECAETARVSVIIILNIWWRLDAYWPVGAGPSAAWCASQADAVGRASRQLKAIDARFGGLAAPGILELDARLAAQSETRMLNH